MTGQSSIQGVMTMRRGIAGKLLCTVQGNDHYDSDYAPCSECRELAEDIADKEAEGA